MWMVHKPKMRPKPIIKNYIYDVAMGQRNALESQNSLS